MVWRRVGGFWGYGDLHPHLVVVMDSIAIVSGSRGRGDSTPIVQWMLSMQVSKAFVMAYAGARVLRGDYLRLTEAAASLGAKRMLIVSMGNDVTDGASAETIGAGLRCLLDRFPGSSVVYGASASVWGYTNQSYDDIVLRVCSNLDCISGAQELRGSSISDSIGHLRVESVPLLCDAVISWSSCDCIAQANV